MIFYIPILLISSMHCEICGNCKIFRHFLLLPLLLSEPPATGSKKGGLVVVFNLNLILSYLSVKLNDEVDVKMILTLSCFEINGIGDDIFQFHQFQLACSILNPLIRVPDDPFPLIFTVIC